MNDLKDIYPALWSAHREGRYAVLDKSLNPRPSSCLYNLIAETGLGADSLIYDLGCGRGNHAVALARYYWCRVVALDPVPANLDLGRAEAAEAGLSERVHFVQAFMEAPPLPPNSADLVWCRDAIVHVANLPRALRACARLLRRGGTVMLFTTVATDLLSEAEARRLFTPLGIVSRNLSRSYVEATVREVGLQVQSVETFGGERVEYGEERDGTFSRELLRLARMIRKQEDLETQLGREPYTMARSLYYWAIYLLIGKLSDVAYLLRS